jgi:gamma-glutamyl phosphate reductase
MTPSHRLSAATLLPAVISFCSVVAASPAELEQAVAILKDTRADRCQQSSLRARVLVAHQKHDEKLIRELYPQLESLNARLKPSEDRLKALSASIRLVPEEQSAFETAQLENGECD